MNTEHTLDHAIHGCHHSMQDITACVMCGKTLRENREHVDTCGKACFRRLLDAQRYPST